MVGGPLFLVQLSYTMIIRALIARMPSYHHVPCAIILCDFHPDFPREKSAWHCDSASPFFHTKFTWDSLRIRCAYIIILILLTTLIRTTTRCFALYLLARVPSIP